MRIYVIVDEVRYDDFTGSGGVSELRRLHYTHPTAACIQFEVLRLDVIADKTEFLNDHPNFEFSASTQWDVDPHEDGDGNWHASVGFGECDWGRVLRLETVETED